MSDDQDREIEQALAEMKKLPPLKYAAAVHVLERIAAGEDRTTEEWIEITEALIAGETAA